MAGERILVVDDEPNVVELVRLYLAREGYQVIEARDGQTALELAQAQPLPDLMILDLMLPQVDGWEVCRRVRARSTLPIIMLTARGEDVDRIVGLELGADDYLPKPFNPRELVARVKAVLRRTSSAAAMAAGAGAAGGEAGASLSGGEGVVGSPATRAGSVAGTGAGVSPSAVAGGSLPGGFTGTGGTPNVLRYPGLSVHRLEREVWVDGERVTLTPKEFDLLWQLASAPGRTFTREELLESVWGYEFFGSDRTVDVHIKRLREKLEKDHHAPAYLQTVWGVGYKFDPLVGR